MEKPEVRFDPILVVESFTALCNRLDAIRETYTSSANGAADKMAMGLSIIAVADFLAAAVPEDLRLGDVLTDAIAEIAGADVRWETRLVLASALASLSEKRGGETMPQICKAIEQEFLANKNIEMPGHKLAHHKASAKHRLFNYRKRLLRQHPTAWDWRRKLYEDVKAKTLDQAGNRAADQLKDLMRRDFFSQPAPLSKKG